jgi:uridine kinase
MVTQYIERKLIEKSKNHRADLKKLGQSSENEPLSKTIVLLDETSQLKGMNTIIRDIDTGSEEFVFYFDRLATLLVEQ